MRPLDAQERLIVKALVRDPRESDNGVGLKTGVNIRTVSRKRNRLEAAGVISFHTNVNLGEEGTKQFTSRHLYIITFRVGVTYLQLMERLKSEPPESTIFTEVVFESHVAEIDGKIALLLYIDGVSDKDIVRTAQEKIIPKLQENHGVDAIENIQTIRILSPVRLLRNYLPLVNMENGYVAKDWPDEGIYVGEASKDSDKGDA